jgi:molybdate transport system ATP-binding protein
VITNPAAGGAAGGAPSLRLDVRRTLHEFELQVALHAQDEVLVLFGPSGAGKSTILNMVAGLVRPDAGSISVDGADVFRKGTGVAVDVPARRRGVGYVMQNYALFPHMTALENVAFPMGRAPDRHRSAMALLDLLSMADHAQHRPGRLSGGQQQRVAVARALASERRILLLDEPFAALDGAIRDRLQADLRRIRQELGVTALLVTHRLEDAFAAGDRLAVMRHGRVEQTGAVHDVFRQPATPAVAEVLGIRNIMEATVVSSDEEALRLDWAGLVLDAPPDSTLAAGMNVSAYVRPDDVKFVYADRPLNESIARNVATGTVTAARESAGSRLLWVALGNGREIEVRFPRLSYSALPLEVGAAVQVALRREGITVLRG